MTTVYGVYLRQSNRHHWELHSAQTDRERALALANKWGIDGRANKWQWAVKTMTTDNPVNWSEQLGWKLPANALVPNTLNEEE